MAITIDDSVTIKTASVRKQLIHCQRSSRLRVPNLAPSPFGGGAASFWKKFGNVFFTHAGFLIFIPGTFNPRIAKHIAMRWSL